MIDFKVEHIQEVSSTNTYLKDLTKQAGVFEGTVILADFQTSGRGRGSSSWVSNRAENLTFSILVEPGIKASHNFSLVEFVSLAMIDTLTNFGINPRIKWPNDIYIADRKIAGILIENVLVENVISSSIIGIGFNVNQDIFPMELPNPVSLKMVLHRSIKQDEIFRKILDQLNFRYEQLKTGAFDLLHREYCNNIYCSDKKICYFQNERIREGILRGISESGELLIENDKGDITGFLFGEIQIL